MRAIPSNYVNLGNFTLNKAVEYFVSVETTSGGTKDCTALLMNVLDYVCCQFDPVLLNFGVKALVPPFYSENVLNLVVVVETHEQLPNYHIQAGTKSSASNYAYFSVLWVAQNVSSGSCLDKFD